MRGVLATFGLFAACVALSGCGGGGGGGGGGAATVSAAGSWTGNWFSSNGINSGALTFTLNQTGNSATGSANFTNSSCFSSGAASGTVSGANYSGNMTAGGINVAYSVTITGNALSGTYNVISGGACTGDSGTLSATRPSASMPMPEHSSGEPNAAVPTEPTTTFAAPGRIDTLDGAAEIPWWLVACPRLERLVADRAAERPEARFLGLIVDRVAAPEVARRHARGDEPVVVAALDVAEVCAAWPAFAREIATMLDADDAAVPTIVIAREPTLVSVGVRR